MPGTTDHRIDSLPQWAQKQFAEMEAQTVRWPRILRECRDTIRGLRNEIEDGGLLDAADMISTLTAMSIKLNEAAPEETSDE